MELEAPEIPSHVDDLIWYQEGPIPPLRRPPSWGPPAYPQRLLALWVTHALLAEGHTLVAGRAVRVR